MGLCSMIVYRGDGKDQVDIAQRLYTCPEAGLLQEIRKGAINCYYALCVDVRNGKLDALRRGSRQLLSIYQSMAQL